MSRESSVAIWALSKANDLINHNTNTIEKRLDQVKIALIRFQPKQF